MDKIMHSTPINSIHAGAGTGLELFAELGKYSPCPDKASQQASAYAMQAGFALQEVPWRGFAQFAQSGIGAFCGILDVAKGLQQDLVAGDHRQTEAMKTIVSKTLTGLSVAGLGIGSAVMLGVSIPAVAAAGVAGGTIAVLSAAGLMRNGEGFIEQNIRRLTDPIIDALSPESLKSKFDVLNSIF